jgi:hypothetical protein
VVSRGLIDTLGIELLFGRDINVHGNTPPNPPRVALITAEFWQHRFAADPNVIGKSIAVNSDLTTIIGVLLAGIQFADNAQILE